MGNQKILLNTHFICLNMGSVNGFLRRKLILFPAFFWVSVSTLFSFFNRIIFRITVNGGSKTSNSDFNEAEKPEVDVTKFEVTERKDKLKEEEEEEETPKLFFKFQFQTYREDNEPVGLESVPPSTTTNKYEFLSEKNFSHYMEDPEAVNYTVKEFYADKNGGFTCTKEIINDGLLSDENFVEEKAEAESAKEKVQEKTFIEEPVSAEEKAALVHNDEFSNQEFGGVDAQFLSEKDIMDSDSDSDSDSIASSHEFMSRFVASTCDGFLSDKDFEDDLWSIDMEKPELTDEDSQNLSTDYENDDFEEEDSDLIEELQKLKEPNSGHAESETLSKGNNSNQEQQSCNEETTGNSHNSPASDSEDSNRLETLWEHQELMEQLRTELKKVKATGLPTILEDDECPKMMEDLKPWRIDEKFQQKEHKMGELHKFYRSYRERMRKFDILNYQKKYAMSLLQSKDPLRPVSSHEEASSPALISLLSLKFLPGKRKKSGLDPTTNFVRELHDDLEMVYVGQMCLSWEILHWQYKKVLELWESDPYLIRRYNEVADEFQQFQVLMQRFIENEPFEGPRLQHYVKNRCISRNLLQVPVIREDSVKDKKAKRKGKDDYTITSDMLVEIMEESIRIFWRFIRADKDAVTTTQKARKGTQIVPQDPTELELLTEVRTNLQKKEKKLKEMLRSGNCMLRKFRKREEDNGSDQVLCFFSQVDMKLVSRVLNMSKITMEQLMWCHNKLSKIDFVNRRIHVEPSFLLFPCC